MTMYDENAELRLAVEQEVDLLLQDLQQGFASSVWEHAKAIFILTGVDAVLVVAMAQDTRALQMAFTTGPKLP